jgi:5-methylcytosine-specific restriction endonuclease McrA
MQDGKCALTGRPLDDTAHIDHIIPKSLGGQSTFDNARWVCKEANVAKFNLMDEALLELCRDIIATIGPKLESQGKSDVA